MSHMQLVNIPIQSIKLTTMMRRTPLLLRRTVKYCSPRIISSFLRINSFKYFTPTTIRRNYTDESGFDDDFKTKVKNVDEERIKQMFDKVKQMIASDKIVLFMKGTPEIPECGFSRAVCQILRFHGYKFSGYNVNADALMKEALKKYSNWPTFPQVYINGEFIGGCDIMVNLHREGELGKLLESSGAEKLKK